MNTQSKKPPMFAKSRNPDLDRSDLRAKVSEFTLAVIDSELHFRLRYTDPRASRNQIINEVIDAYVTRQRIQAEMRLGLAPECPFHISPLVPTRIDPQEEQVFTDLRANVLKTSLDVIDAIVKHRCLYVDASTSRNDVVCEILDSWAVLQWHRSNMTLEAIPCNPHCPESEVAHG